MKAIIIGAGRGIRMMPETEHIPKCMLEGINGHRVLDWILGSVQSAGADDVIFIGGYQSGKVQQAYPGLRFRENTAWCENDTLESLMSADQEMDGGFIASYSDILYPDSVVSQLINCPAEMALAIDRNWQKSIAGRPPKHELQAEKVIAERGRIVQAGRYIPVDQAYGEFIGLLKVGPGASDILRTRYDELRRERPDAPFHEAPSLHMASLTDMIQELIDLGVRVEPVDICANWTQLDTLDELEWARTQSDAHTESRLAQRFWAVRAKGYQALEWTSRKGYIETFVAAGDFQRDDCVLDVGTGTGIVAHAISPLVSQVVGVDVSPEMREYAVKSHAPNELFEDGDIRRLRFADSSFDKVTARMVFHHLLDGRHQAMSECFRVLKPNGLMVLSEGIPPDKSLGSWYTAMFALKEPRLTFFEEDLVALMERPGLIVEKVIPYVARQVSIRNWLHNSGIPQERQDMIMQLHLNLDAAGKQYYNMTIKDHDVLCDFKFLVLVGRRPAA